MILKKMISICFLFVVLAAASLWIDRSIHRSFETPQPELSAVTETEAGQEVTASMSSIAPAKYYLAEQDGKIVVYQADQTTIYFETSIATDSLPQTLLDELSDGICFTTEKELYEFLENYSS